MSKRLRDGNAVDYDVDMKKEQETYDMFSANWWYQYMKREIDERRVGRVYAHLKLTSNHVNLHLQVYKKADLPPLHSCLVLRPRPT